MKTITDSAVAMAQLEGWVRSTSEPTLTSTEMTDLLARHVRATVWTAETSVTVGDRVVPTVLNGCWYECVTEGDATGGGTTGATEPTWTAFTTWPDNQTPYIQDGTVLWKYIGAAPDSLWAVREAAIEGLDMKIAAMAGVGTLKAGSLTVSGADIVSGLQAQRSRLKPVGFA